MIKFICENCKSENVVISPSTTLVFDESEETIAIIEYKCLDCGKTTKTSCCVCDL